jgi:hypothetical protein
MGKQVGFFALESDMALVLRAADEDGFRAIDECIESDVAPSLRPALDGRPTPTLGRFFLLPPEVDAMRLDYGEPAADGKRLLRWWKAPVIEVIVSLRKDDVLEEGRIYLPTSTAYTPIVDRLDRQHPSLGRTYARMARIIQRWLPADVRRFFIGPAAAAAATSGGLRIDTEHLKPPSRSARTKGRRGNAKDR